MGHFASAGLYLLDLIFMLAVALFMLRLLLQWSGASFYNPISQFFYQATNPVLIPLRRTLPTVRRVNSGALVIGWLIAIVEAWLLAWLLGHPMTLFASLTLGIATVLSVLLGIVFFTLLLTVLISLINPHADHAIAQLAWQLTDPLLRPIRRWLPMLGPFDLSPLALFLGIFLARALIVAPLRDLGAMLARGGI